jgi:UDP-glucose 4-epimerase
VEGTLHLLLGMRKAGVDKIVFSSTAAVYGEPEKTPIEEDFPHNPTNVYGRTKLVIEDMMRDFTAAYGFYDLKSAKKKFGIDNHFISLLPVYN